ncbi:DUF3830 family protein [Phytoactinopolyspora limicola]|uniref:DUF3830 family protein n=1 Tax=Phytoactinopolyspora limicola TaxID=2715536 RepID=UPI00140D3D03|nr:DUF3830 family protein [Phytoactinopolyspora limicola]
MSAGATTDLLVFEFVDHGVAVRARLNTAGAPNTCAVVGGIASTEPAVRAYHAIFSGRQLGIHVAPEVAGEIDGAREVPPECATAFPAPGDVLWQYCPPGKMDGGPEIFDLALCYGRDTRILMPWGFSPANRFAQVVDEDLPSLAKLGATMIETGAENVRIRSVA